MDHNSIGPWTQADLGNTPRVALRTAGLSVNVPQARQTLLISGLETSRDSSGKYNLWNSQWANIVTTYRSLYQVKFKFVGRANDIEPQLTYKLAQGRHWPHKNWGYLSIDH